MGNMGELGRRIGKRLLNFILVVWGVVTLSFCLQVFTGTDPAEMIVREPGTGCTLSGTLYRLHKRSADGGFGDGHY